MARKLGFPKLIKYTELEDNETIFEMARYDGSTQSKFGTLYLFYDMREQESASIPSCGILKYHIENGNIEEGDLVKLTFLGKEVMTKGAYKGKEANTLEIEIWDDQEEVEELLAKWGVGKKKPKPKPRMEAVEEDEEDEEPAPVKRRSKAAAKVEVDDDSEEIPVRRKAAGKGKAALIADDEDEEDEPAPVVKKRGRPRKEAAEPVVAKKGPGRPRKESIDELDSLV
jgi:hypothetical protein